MRYIHCDGCDRKESEEMPPEESIMMPVTVLFSTADNRSWASDKREKYESHLCDRCRPQLLHTFFKVPQDFDTELPRWMSAPTSALGT